MSVDCVEDSRTRLHVYSGYGFRAMERPQTVARSAQARLERAAILGTVVIAPEGINFSLSGDASGLDAWVADLRGELGIERPVVNRQRVDQPPFSRLKVRVRPEIVTFDPRVRPDRAPGGRPVAPAHWNALIDRDEVQLVDTRNDYEFALGSFDGARNPDTESFTDFKAFCNRRLDPERPVAMFCTGGVRCEKAGVWMRELGFSEVYQLEGGVLGYLAEVPEQQSRWRGECFVFDDRVSVDASLRPTGRVICKGCRFAMPGLDAAGNPPLDRDGRCAACHRKFDAGRLLSLRERARQTRLALAREQV